MPELTFEDASDWRTATCPIRAAGRTFQLIARGHAYLERLLVKLDRRSTKATTAPSKESAANVPNIAIGRGSPVLGVVAEVLAFDWLFEAAFELELEPELGTGLGC